MESQMELAEARRAAAPKPALTDEQIRLLREREGLEMSRTRVLHDLETVHHPRYREQLQSALKHLEQRLAALNP